jgi:hypothetical protein
MSVPQTPIPRMTFPQNDVSLDNVSPNDPRTLGLVRLGLKTLFGETPLRGILGKSRSGKCHSTIKI